MSTSNGVDEQKGKSNGTNKTYAYIAAGIVVLAIAAWGIYAYNHQNKNAQENAQQAASQNNSNILADTSTPPSSGTVPAKLSYGEAIKAYPYRFQFSGCHGNPGSMSVKKGSIVMLDNRDSVSHTIKADSQTFKIAGYDYALLRTSVLSNTFITCDGGGAATLNVEK